MGRIITVCITALFASFSSASAETTLGRWCDRSVPSMPELNREVWIVVEENGSLVELSYFADGGPVRRQLQEVSGDVFHVVDSWAGDGMRIVRTTGDLQLFDNDGFISVARRLENTPRESDCLVAQ